MVGHKKDKLQEAVRKMWDTTVGTPHKDALAVHRVSTFGMYWNGPTAIVTTKTPQGRVLWHMVEPHRIRRVLPMGDSYPEAFAFHHQTAWRTTIFFADMRQPGMKNLQAWVLGALLARGV